MPELPEVEVTKRGIEPVMLNERIVDLWHDEKKLRLPFPPQLDNLLNAKIESVQRRSKFILIITTQGVLLIHLGMTGHLSILGSETQRTKHDHFEIMLSNGSLIRYNDIRRFGLVDYYASLQECLHSKLLKNLGPEPLESEFTAEYLKKALGRKKLAIKQALMDSTVVVGVGNIYASEVLFKAHINPQLSSNQISLQQCEQLVPIIQQTLREAIAMGGTTIRDFEGADGKLGYFVQNLMVYGHEKERCRICGSIIRRIIQGQRSTFYCPQCQA